jgi:hypothetical protein
MSERAASGTIRTEDGRTAEGRWNLRVGCAIRAEHTGGTRSFCGAPSAQSKQIGPADPSDGADASRHGLVVKRTMGEWLLCVTTTKQISLNRSSRLRTVVRCPPSSGDVMGFHLSLTPE